MSPLSGGIREARALRSIVTVEASSLYLRVFGQEMVIVPIVEKFGGYDCDILYSI